MGRSTRRRFLELGVLMSATVVATRSVAAGWQRGLERFAAPAPPCTDAPLTPALPDSGQFRGNSPQRGSLREKGTSGSAVSLTGSVIGVRCGQIKDARVDFWHADPGGSYDASGSRFRGYQLTDPEGRYHLETLMPGAPAGRARHINVRVTPPDKAALTTALYFPDDAGNARDKWFRPELLMKRAALPSSFSVPSLGSSVSSPSSVPSPSSVFSFSFILDL